MQLFVRDAGHALVEAEVDSTVADVKTAYMLKTYGTVLPHDAIVSDKFPTFLFVVVVVAVTIMHSRRTTTSLAGLGDRLPSLLR
jgi:hypothetical protein